MKMRIVAAKLTTRALPPRSVWYFYNDGVQVGGTGTYKMVGMGENMEMPITWNESKSEFCLWGLNALNMTSGTSFP